MKYQSGKLPEFEERYFTLGDHPNQLEMAVRNTVVEERHVTSNDDLLVEVVQVPG